MLLGPGWHRIVCSGYRPTAGVTLPDRYSSAAVPRTGDSGSEALRLESRHFSIGVLLACHLDSRTNFKLIRAAAPAEWWKLLSA